MSNSNVETSENLEKSGEIVKKKKKNLRIGKTKEENSLVTRDRLILLAQNAGKTNETKLEISIQKNKERNHLKELKEQMKNEKRQARLERKKEKLEKIKSKTLEGLNKKKK